jgi:hypothetical protein
MEISGVGSAVVRGTRLRLSSLLIAFAMLAGSLLLIQQRADAAPAGAVAAAVALPALDAPAQINIDVGALIRNIVCPILFSVRDAFDDGPFGGFVTPILNNLLAAFGCTASG